MRARDALGALAVTWTVLTAQAGSQWFLFGRHGECADVAVLKRRLPDLPAITGPDEFVRYLRAKGVQYTEQPHPVPAGRAVEVQVPDRGLALVFVTAEMCPAGDPVTR